MGLQCAFLNWPAEFPEAEFLPMSHLRSLARPSIDYGIIYRL
jgi:hypothetical protein